MTQIYPFPGIRYNSDRIDDLALVISQPYDKISPEDRQILWDRHEHNTVRLILPPPDGTDTDFATESSGEGASDWYSQAAKRFQSWMQEGLLVADTPRIYVYRQTFTYLDQTYTRSGIYVALQLDDQGGPLAHEHTFEGPKADRFRLISASKTNLSPIFLLSDGSMNQWDKVLTGTGETIFKIDDPDGQKHEILPIENPEAIQAAQEYVQGRTLVIADGHHRYETAQNYKRKMMQETGKDPLNEPWGSVMAFIVPAESPDLLVLPTHRVISEMPEHWMETLISKAEPYGTVEPLTGYSGTSLREMLAQPEHQQSVAVTGQEKSILFTMNPSAEPPALQSIAAPLRKLNVSVLHQFLLESCLKLTPTALQGITRYIRGEKEALDRVQKGEAQAAFLLGGLSPKTVLDVSQHHVRMPQKSTDFYPKIPTGLIFRSVRSTG